jgi:hypothetical protein
VYLEIIIYIINCESVGSMDFIEIPNLPQKAVSLAVVDGRISKEAELKLKNMNVDIIKTNGHKGLYKAISHHPDIFLHHLGGDQILYAPGTDKSLLEQLSYYGFKLSAGVSILEPYYPTDIAYNVARNGRFFFHNLRYTDPELRKALDGLGLEPVDVKQGYTKCSISIVDENSIITADVGIAKAAEKKGIEVLLLEPGQGIFLPGVKYGFIGGSSGLLDKNLWAVNGNAYMLSSHSLICDFLTKKNIEIISLSESIVTDIGGILPLKY